MSITKRQFNLLQAMGIDVWQRRDLSNDTASTANSTAESEQIEANSESYQAPQIIFNDVNIEQLNDTTIFHDILRCLGVTFAEVNINDKTINLGLINWQLADTDEITFEHNCLVSPPLEKIAHSSTLKRDLWQSIGHVSHQ